MKRSGLFSPRGLGLLATVAILVGLSLGSTGWAQVARAQTVPTLTFTPAPTLAASPRPTAILPTATPSPPPGTSSVTSRPSATQVIASASPSGSPSTPASPAATVPPGLAACWPGPYILATQVASRPVQLVLGVGQVTLLAPDGLDGQGGAPLTVSTFGAQIVPNDQLPAAPSGWHALGCGLQATAVGAAGQIVDFLTRGLIACLTPPADTSRGKQLRLAYFDPRLGIGRWVFIPSHDSASQLCSSRFHLPGTFALLTSPS